MRDDIEQRKIEVLQGIKTVEAEMAEADENKDSDDYFYAQGKFITLKQELAHLNSLLKRFNL